MHNDINLSPAVALARSSIHQLTISPDTMDLVCHGPSTVNPDAFNPPITVYVLYTFYVFLICFDYQIIALASLGFT